MIDKNYFHSLFEDLQNELKSIKKESLELKIRHTELQESSKLNQTIEETNANFERYY